MSLCMCLYTYKIILIKVIISMVEEPDMLNNYKYLIRKRNIALIFISNGRNSLYPQDNCKTKTKQPTVSGKRLCVT